MIPSTMHAVLLQGHGGLEQLSNREDVTDPRPAAGEVLIAVSACGVNNTDINTRIGWYSKAVTADTESGGAQGFETVNDDDASWSGIPLHFPRIQGADVCGRVVAVGDGVSSNRIGERVLVQTIQPLPEGSRALCMTFGSECDGGFAQFAVAKSEFTHTIDCDWSDAELASIPCAYSTAENMLHRAFVGAERVLVSGASGGVGSAAVQLARRRGAEVIALSSPSKADEVISLGAHQVLDRDCDLVTELGADSIDVVIDLVAGPQWPHFLDVLKPGGRYAVAGAIAGPITELDVRTLYLKDLSLFGCTCQAAEVFPNLVSYIERGEIKPALAATYPLNNISQAQEDFLAKRHTGKLVLIPPSPEE